MQEIIQQLFDDPAARQFLYPIILFALSVALAPIGQVFKWLPDSICPPATIPWLLACLGWIAGKVLTIMYPWLPDVLPTLFAGAGFGAKAAHDHPWGAKTMKAGGSAGKKIGEMASGIWAPKE